MSAPDLQSFVEQLEQRGWLHRVRVEVDPVLEISEIADRVTKAGGPALLFERVRGHEWPVLINTFGTRERMCLALGAESFEQVAERVAALIKPEMPATLMDKIRKLPELAQLAQLPPKIVRRGVCQQVVHEGEAADVTKLPAIQCWPGDGDVSRNVADGIDPARYRSGTGRYITLGAVFTKDPETQQRNIGMYRVQIFEPRLCAMHWHMHHDGARHFRKYKRLGRRMPVAIALGGPALLPYAGTCPLPPDMDEALFLGFLQGRPLELVRCVSQSELEVPATAEIVIEGYIDPDEEPLLEGPFGDHTGFYSMADLYPSLHITAITHRERPIYPTTIVGKPPQEDFWLGKATERIFLPALKMLVPDIIDYNLPMFGCFHNCAFVKIRKEYPYHARRVMHAIWGAGQMAFTKIIVVVDEHVDVHDEQDVLFHVCANVDPRRDIVFVDGPLDILDHATPVCGAGSKMGIDATAKWPGEGQVRRWPDEIEMTPEVRELVTRRWAEYGLAGLIEG